jgi:hypothetical protein
MANAGCTLDYDLTTYESCLPYLCKFKKCNLKGDELGFKTIVVILEMFMIFFFQKVYDECMDQYVKK